MGTGRCPSFQSAAQAAHQRRQIQGTLCDTTPHTPAGLIVLIKLLASFQATDPAFTDGRDETLSRNILAALERFPPGLVEAEWGPINVPDPVVVAFPAPEPKPDPVVTLFAKWAIIRDEATALSAAMDAAGPKGTDYDELNERWENALTRCDAVEDQIMETPATSIQGVAIKIRIVSHYIFEAGDLYKRHATPARDINYVEADPGSGASGLYVVSALRDAERLAGVS